MFFKLCIRFQFIIRENLVMDFKINVVLMGNCTLNNNVLSLAFKKYKSFVYRDWCKLI